MNVLLLNFMEAGGAIRQKLTAYALGTKQAGLISDEVMAAYNRSKIDAGLSDTPAAAKTSEPARLKG